MKWTAATLFAIILLSFPAMAETIAPGQTRVAVGKLVAVSPAHGSVVVEMPTDKGPLIVGVTLNEGVKPSLNGKPAALKDLPTGLNARLTYTREGDRLLGTALMVTGN